MGKLGIRPLMNNDTIKKKHQIYVETLMGENHGQRRKLHHEFFRDITKVQRNRENTRA